MAELKELEQRIKTIEERNLRVESDKAWETSNTRRLLLVVTTYIIMSLIMWSIGVAEPFKNAIIPTLGFFLSTLSLPVVKKMWLAKRSA